jgi:hypothetical protein
MNKSHYKQTFKLSKINCINCIDKLFLSKYLTFQCLFLYYPSLNLNYLTAEILQDFELFEA